jgi:hypothetical protein
LAPGQSGYNLDGKFLFSESFTHFILRPLPGFDSKYKLVDSIIMG